MQRALGLSYPRSGPSVLLGDSVLWVSLGIASFPVQKTPGGATEEDRGVVNPGLSSLLTSVEEWLREVGVSGHRELLSEASVGPAVRNQT